MVVSASEMILVPRLQNSIFGFIGYVNLTEFAWQSIEGIPSQVWVEGFPILPRVVALLGSTANLWFGSLLPVVVVGVPC